MGELTGSSIKNISIKRQSDVVIKKTLAVYATVNVEADTALEPGQVLITTDGGDTFTVPVDNAAEPNGILCENISKTGKSEVLVVGIVREKYLDSYVADYKVHLFANKIILK